MSIEQSGTGSGIPDETAAYFDKLRQKAEDHFGVELRPITDFPDLNNALVTGERSGSVPIGKPGASIVGAARALRAMRRGQTSMRGGPITERAQELVARSEAARAAAEQETSE